MRETEGLKYIWILTLISSYFGSYLSWQGMPGLFAYRLLLGIHGILFAAVFYGIVSQGRKIMWDFQVRPYFIFLAFWLIWGLFSLLWAPSILFGIKNLFYLGSGCLIIFFSLYYFSTLRDLWVLFMVNMLVLFFQIALGLWELKSGFHIYGSLPQYYLRHNELTVIGTFGHPNNFATYLSMFLPLLFVWGKSQKNKAVMWIAFVISILGLHLIISSTSRANMMAMMLGFIAVFVLMLINYWGQFKSKFMKTVLIAAIVLGMGIFSLAYQYLNLSQIQLKEEVMSVFENWEEDGSIKVRKTLIIKGLEMLKGTYGFGVGAGNAQFLMEQHRDETFGFIKMHNWWVEVLVDYGVLVWILFLFFFAKILGDLFKIFLSSRHKELKMWAEGLIISLCMFSVGVISNGSMMASAHMWILFGSALSVINVYKLMGKEGKNA